jgi:hypothetical protein
MSFDEVLFTKVCTLEAKLELAEKRMAIAEAKLAQLTIILENALQVILEHEGAKHGISETTRNQ